jgi:predicted nucleotidyltransferase
MLIGVFRQITRLTGSSFAVGTTSQACLPDGQVNLISAVHALETGNRLVVNDFVARLPVLRGHAITPRAVEMRENIRQDGLMNKEEVISKLQAHEPELKAAGIVRLAVFGSVARGDNSPESDVDLLADFDKTKRYTLLTMGRLENRLSDLLGRRVDLSSPEWLKESVKSQALREAVVAF